MIVRLKKLPKNNDKLVLNKLYEVKPLNKEYYKNNHFILENSEIWWEVFENGLSIGLYDRKCFETLKEFRGRKLKELGI